MVKNNSLTRRLKDEVTLSALKKFSLNSIDNDMAQNMSILHASFIGVTGMQPWLV